MEEYEEIECADCSGQGEYDQMQYCFKPMSECCGGCTITVVCEECNGNGYILEEIE